MTNNNVDPFRKIDPDVMQDFYNWLAGRQTDIAYEIEDFGELKEFYTQLIGREPEI